MGAYIICVKLTVVLVHVCMCVHELECIQVWRNVPAQITLPAQFVLSTTTQMFVT